MFNSLFVRLVIAQMFVLFLAFAAMLILVGQSRGAAAARTIAPIWAASIQNMRDGSAISPQSRAPMVTQPGPPPLASRAIATRYGVLREELAAYGLLVREIRVGRAEGREMTWLEIEAQDGRSSWVGFDGGVFGPDERAQRWPVIVFALLLVTAMSITLTWMIVMPLKRIQRAIEQFGTSGSGPLDQLSRATTRGPEELQALARSFVDMVHERGRLEQDRTLMLAGVSHDLRSPLARIRLHAQLMPDADPTTRESKQAIMRNVDLADRHIAEFMDFAVPTAVNDWRTVDVATIWHEVVELALPDTHNAEAKIDPPASSVQTSPRLLSRLLASGLENAYKHGAPPYVLRVFRRDRTIVFEIEDGGVGVPLADRSRILRPFERGAPSRTTPGTGLGLALSVQIAQRLGGHVELDQAERGLIFRCILADSPLKAEATS
jgi:two-component system, OmpR family, osmolarity sensor histidine kinase EnvZ